MQLRPHAHWEERRQASRFARDEELEQAAVWFSPGEGKVYPVCDESLGGISLVVDDPARFPVGDDMGIAYARSFYQATVVHVHQRDDGAFIVGFEMHELG
ncbi:MAG: hypothetical protein KY475_12760 [Planctomycetes bacterium]|nr:hypothetical protein [Planctomycetota bacterium]